MKRLFRLWLLIALCLALVQCTTTLLLWDRSIAAGKEFLFTGDFERAIEYFQTAFSKSADEYQKSVSKAYEAWANIGVGNFPTAMSLLEESEELAHNEVSASGRLYACYIQGDYTSLAEHTGDIYRIPSDFSLKLRGDTLTKTEIANLLMLGLAARYSKNEFTNLKLILDGVYSDPLIDEMEAFFF